MAAEQRADTRDAWRTAVNSPSAAALFRNSAVECRHTEIHSARVGSVLPAGGL